MAESLPLFFHFSSFAAVTTGATGAALIPLPAFSSPHVQCILLAGQRFPFDSASCEPATAATVAAQPGLRVASGCGGDNKYLCVLHLAIFNRPNIYVRSLGQLPWTSHPATLQFNTRHQPVDGIAGMVGAMKHN
jgi:hypothetical protein